MKFDCFIMMQFKGSQQELIFNKINEAINNFNTVQQEHKITARRADFSVPLNLDNLEDHIKKHIEMCHFAIAEISEENLNVAFEVGAASALGKPIIIMKKEAAKLHSDISGRVIFEYEDIDLIPQKLQSYIISVIHETLALQNKNTYFVKAHTKRENSDFIEKLKDIEYSGDFLTTNLEYLINSGSINILKEKMNEYAHLKIRILTLDPESDFTGHRADQIGKPRRIFRETLRENLDNTYQLLNDYKSCEIRAYSDLPVQITYRIDDTIYHSVVSANRQGRDNLLFRLNKRNAGVQDALLTHFETVWAKSYEDTGCLTNQKGSIMYR